MIFITALLEKYENKQRNKRLFRNKLKNILFLEAGIKNMRVVWIRQAKIMVTNYQDNDKEQINNRKMNFMIQGINPPKNSNECLQLIKDLELYKI